MLVAVLLEYIIDNQINITGLVLLGKDIASSRPLEKAEISSLYLKWLSENLDAEYSG
jgi:hypothetical protein